MGCASDGPRAGSPVLNSRGPTPPVMFRAPTNDDVPYITRAWLKSYRSPGAMLHHVPQDVYYTQHHRIIERLWFDDNCTKLVACFPEDTTFIYGFLFAECTNVGPVVHYVYVRRPMRGLGLASALLDAVRYTPEGLEPRGFISHHTPAWEALERGQLEPFNTVYSPYLAFKEFQFPGRTQ